MLADNNSSGDGHRLPLNDDERIRFSLVGLCRISSQALVTVYEI